MTLFHEIKNVSLWKMNCRYQLLADALMALSVAPGWAVCVCVCVQFDSDSSSGFCVDSCCRCRGCMWKTEGLYGGLEPTFFFSKQL